MQQGGFARVVEPEEQELGVFVEQAQRGEDVVDLLVGTVSRHLFSWSGMAVVAGVAPVGKGGEVNKQELETYTS